MSSEKERYETLADGCRKTASELSTLAYKTGINDELTEKKARFSRALAVTKRLRSQLQQAETDFWQEYKAAEKQEKKGTKNNGSTK